MQTLAYVSGRKFPGVPQVLKVNVSGRMANVKVYKWKEHLGFWGVSVFFVVFCLPL